MGNNESNPFSISKSNDLTDEEIYKLWVDDMNFIRFIDPKSLTPKIIIGGKGSGKTHLMRYFSYEVQLQKNKSIKNTIIKDGYLGIFIRASTLFGSRFNHKTDKNKWQVIFYYYFELFITSKYLLPILKQLIKEYPKQEQQLLIEINKLFDCPLKNIKKLLDIDDSITKEIQSINIHINKYLFDNNSINNINPSVSKTSLLFGIPKIVKKIFKDTPKIKSLVFNYFIDEFENFEPAQQQYIQTIVRESGDICTFRLGIRTYDFDKNILKTEHDTEVNKIGSEISFIDLDEWLMEKKSKYIDFAVKIIQKKFNPKNITEYKEYKEYLASLFKNNGGKIDSTKAFDELDRELKKLKTTPSNQEMIIKNLKIKSSDEHDKNMIEKINIYKFYKKNKKSSNLVQISSDIKKECRLFLDGGDSTYSKDIEKQKENMLAQLYKENGSNNPIYLGLENIIKISFFNPRHFINLMSYIYEYSDYYEEDIKDKISEDIQIKALQKLANWFEDDYDKTGDYGHKLKEYSDRLCRYLEAIRFSPAPIDTSVTIFYINNDNFAKYKDKLSALSGRLIFIDRNKDRLGKNTKNKDRAKSFQINYIYSEKYKLPVISRGSVELRDTDLKAIFSDNDKDFKKMLAKKCLITNNEQSQQKLF